MTFVHEVASQDQLAGFTGQAMIGSLGIVNNDGVSAASKPDEPDDLEDDLEEEDDEDEDDEELEDDEEDEEEDEDQDLEDDVDEEDDDDEDDVELEDEDNSAIVTRNTENADKARSKRQGT